MSGWEEVCLGDYIEFFNGYAFKSALFTDSKDDLVLVKGENLGKGCILWEKSKYWNKEDEIKYGKFILAENDIVLAMDRPWVNGGLKYAIIRKGDPKSFLVQRVGRIRAKNGAFQGFIRWVIASESFSAYVNNIMGGVGVPHISPKQVCSYKFNIPQLHIQQKIASILSAYDDLIENNLKRIKLLEEIAQRTYDEWFVKFRVNGEELAIDEGTGLPEGWKRKKLAEIAELVMGQSPKSEFYNKESRGLPFHQGVSDYGNRFPSNSTWSTEGSRYAEKGDILFSVRAPVGRLNIAIEKIILGRGLAAIRHKDGFNNALYYQLQKTFFKDDIMGAGAIFNSVTKKDVENIDIVEATRTLLQAFKKIAEPIDRQIEKLTIQNRILKETLDILLPRLMSGEIDVEEMALTEVATK